MNVRRGSICAGFGSTMGLRVPRRLPIFVAFCAVLRPWRDRARRLLAGCYSAGCCSAGVPSRSALEEGGTGAERDGTHSGAGHELLGAVEVEVVRGEVDPEAEAGGYGDAEVEQEQEPEHGLGGEQRLHGVSPFVAIELRGDWGPTAVMRRRGPGRRACAVP